VVSEFGGVASAGSGFGYSQFYGDEDMLRIYREMVEALMQPGPVVGFCYTQLTDIEHEQNGLLTFDRHRKADLQLIRKVTETKKQY
jgi:hypothetical protein